MGYISDKSDKVFVELQQCIFGSNFYPEFRTQYILYVSNKL